jgi:3-hydroxymyristoyl/3-hydroxydecanoyl-(acyl carrier protein) dehydratase
MLNLDEIKSILPQSYPFLLIDKIEEVKLGESLVAIKNITANEWPFAGGGAQSVQFPPTLLIEAAAQAALLFYRHAARPTSNTSHGRARGLRPGHVASEVRPLTESNLRYFIGKVEAEFFAPVYVGDRLYIKVANSRMFGQMGLANVGINTQEQIANIKLFVGKQ